MSVTITQQSDDLFLVNGKCVFLDSSGQWCSKIELTTEEYRIFIKHLESLKKEIN